MYVEARCAEALPAPGKNTARDLPAALETEVVRRRIDSYAQPAGQTYWDDPDLASIRPKVDGDDE
jgi:tRNA uridine 5-carbamoylmethylation protein Kti12